MARKVLLADDSVTAQNMGRKILTDAGYEVVTVNNGSAALKKITETQPDVIVLDVYMPGYSGLEVCQRIKDARDTAHIPVLLTVGKLEPFKQDEARRVRADAFIIKPFEASELMAALTKLEGKAGGVASPKKEGRRSEPPTMESFERTLTARAPQFGDEESGWKARIKFPSPESKQPEPESEAYTPPPAVPFRELIPETPSASSQTSPAASMTERPIPAGIPHDITPDEIAAITAAAARVRSGASRKDSETAHEESAANVESRTASVPEAGVKRKHDEPAETLPSSEAAVAAISSLEPQVSMAPERPEQTKKESHEGFVAEPNVVSEEPRVEGSPVETPTPPAVEALSSAALGTPVDGGEQPSDSEEPVTIAAVGSAVAETDEAASTREVSRRWIAEEIPVEAEEAVLVLEHEMQKAYAAFAAAEIGAKYESAPVDRNDEPMFATMAPPAIGSPLPMMGAAVETHSEQEELRSELQEASRAITAETARFEVPKPPTPPFAAAGANRDDSAYAVAAFGDSPQPGGTAEAASVPVAADEVKPAQSPISDLDAVVAVPESTHTAVEENSIGFRATDDSRETELAAATAAAWANWRDVRESVLGPGAPAKSGAAASGSSEAELELKKVDAHKKDEPVSQPEAALAAAASVDGSSAADPNLSSIVDSMLAELKPKLMAELAEKLKKEKSKK